jgi:hypothetical protein
MTTDPYRSGGAEYGAAPQYAPQPPSMRPVGSPPAATPAPAYAQEAWGASPAGAEQAPANFAKLPNEVLLSKPYKAHGSDVQHLTFREPTVPEIRRLGYPFRTGLNAQGVPSALEEIPDVVGNYIALLAKPPLPPSTVNQMTPADFSRCSGAVLSFFLG